MEDLKANELLQHEVQFFCHLEVHSYYEQQSNYQTETLSYSRIRLT